MQRDTGEAEPPAPPGATSPRPVLCYYTTGICIYFLFLLFFFLNNKRILMPHINSTFYVQTRGELEKVR